MNATETRPLALLLDFDGTAALYDTGDLLLEAFTDKRWKELDDLWKAGKITGKECLEQQFGFLPSDREALVSFALKRQRLRPGLRPLLRYCKEHDIPVALVSGGMDFYIRAILEAQGLDMRVFSAVADFSGPNIRLTYPPGTVVCDAVGACKCAHVDRLRAQGYRVAYAGDGNSDRCVAPRADLLFARDELLAFCQEQGIPHTPFNTLHEVLACIKEQRFSR